ncbi:MAG: GNAT family N-acetyltransferase [bacterium]|nr:GNAT family N-acetyltransferase [bacterium]
MEEFLIREFSTEDYAKVYDVWAASGLAMRVSDSLPELKKVLDRDPELFLVAECAGVIAGAVLGAYDGRRGWIYHLGVHPTYQRRGVGKALMTELLARYTTIGVNKVNLMITAENLKVCEFYKSLGFILHDYVVMGIPLRGEY